MSLHEARAALAAAADPTKAAFFPRFFKSGEGEYGEGDQFLGVTVPNVRLVARNFHTLTLSDLHQLLESEWHEERLLALIIMVLQYAKPFSGGASRSEIYGFYLEHTTRINNWDLVDVSCRDIIGWHIYDHPELQDCLDELTASDLLWDRRIAMVSTFYFLMHQDPEPTLRITAQLLPDRHDLIQKAVGWMLRELGKRVDEQLLVDFLRQHYDQMGRTTLRYAIERFAPSTRARYLRGHF